MVSDSESCSTQQQEILDKEELSARLSIVEDMLMGSEEEPGLVTSLREIPEYLNKEIRWCVYILKELMARGTIPPAMDEKARLQVEIEEELATMRTRANRLHTFVECRAPKSVLEREHELMKKTEDRLEALSKRMKDVEKKL